MKTSDQLKSSAPPEAVASELTAPCAPRQTILLAEDDRSIRRYLEVILQKAGYTVITASDGVEAMKIVMTTALDAVVTDAIMPHLGGHELCRFLRRQPKLSQLPVILLSGIENQAAAAAADGANVYLTKPISPTDLINCLEQLF
ncbi:MAG: twitching motility two-component system response regulator PilH [Blastocatellia bacterium]|jgi:CheY-like chemotaxis protein|nr:twitching motility two-component system response regulator PilH [Blastocatellia bacterium]